MGACLQHAALNQTVRFACPAYPLDLDIDLAASVNRSPELVLLDEDHVCSKLIRTKGTAIEVFRLHFDYSETLVIAFLLKSVKITCL